MAFLRLIPPVAWAGIGAAILAAAAAFWAIAYNKGVAWSDLKWDKAMLWWQSDQIKKNVNIDRETYKRDADVLRRIEGAKTKWQNGSQ